MKLLCVTGSEFLSRYYYWFLNIFDNSYTKKILIESWQLLGQLWPYLVIGILLTVLIKLYISKNRLAAFFNRKQRVSIILAALIGVISPLGSYVIIPLSSALFTIGVPLPVLIALLIASPLIDPNLFLLTYGAFGMKMALARTLSAFLLGVFSGYGILWLSKSGAMNNGKILNSKNNKSVANFINGENKPTLKLFGTELYKMSLYVSKYFFLAILLSAIIKILVSPNYLMRFFNGNEFMSVLLTTAAGVPFYVCGGAAIPVVQQLAQLGLSKGAVLSFFISGPVTKISNLVLMQSAFSTKVFLYYLFCGISGAFLFGILYNLI